MTTMINKENLNRIYKILNAAHLNVVKAIKEGRRTELLMHQCYSVSDRDRARMRNYRGLGIEEIVTSSRLLYRREDYVGKMEIFLLNAEVVVEVEVCFKGGRAWEMIEDTTVDTAGSYITVRTKHDVLTGAPDQSNVYTAVFTYFNDDIKYALDNYEKEHPGA